VYYILLDEVQLPDRFEEVLNSLLGIENVDVYVKGSNSKFLSKDIITEFSGRGDKIHIYPLTFAEFYAAVGGEYDGAWDEYLNYGGLTAILICGEKDHAGSRIRYNKAWHKNTGIPIEWIKYAGHNSNTRYFKEQLKKTLISQHNIRCHAVFEAQHDIFHI